jgi:hypothetical protein
LGDPDGDHFMLHISGADPVRRAVPIFPREHEIRQAVLASSELHKYALSVLDRMSGLYGPDTLLVDVLLRTARRRADRTGHKVGDDAPVSDGAHGNANAATHGGDGNSGECEHAAETEADDRTASESACGAGAAGDTPDCRDRDAVGDDASNGGAPERSGSSAHDAGQPTGKGDDGAEEATEGMGSHLTDDVSTSADEEPDGNRCPAKGDAESVGGETCDQPQASGDAGAPEADSQDAPSGRVAKVSPALARVAEVTRIARALSRLVADATRPEPSPLWDGKRVVREITSRQVRMHRMRRDVPAPRGLLVLYDVSGSCESIAARTWGIAAALAARYSGFYAAATPASGGDAEGSLDPSSIVGRGARRFARLAPIVGNGHGDDVAGWARLKAAGVSHILVFGDAHGSAGYRAAYEACIHVLWCNPNAHIAPSDTSWCDYTTIRDGDIAAAVETLTRRV